VPFRRVASILCLVAVAPQLACSGDGSAETQRVRVYSSMPQEGAEAGHARAIERGMRLALRQAGGRSGDFQVEYVALSATSPGTPGWSPESVAANARRAVQDEDAIALVGEFNSEASEISMQIVNAAPLAQVTPLSAATGLTVDEPGAGPAEPERHYPTGRRHLVRLAPRDTIQARALALLMRDEGCQAVEVSDDGSSYADRLRPALRSAADAAALRLTLGQPTRELAPVAARAARAGCFAYLGSSTPDAARLLDGVAAGAPGAKLFGPDALVSVPRAIDVGRQAEQRLLLTAPFLAEREYPPAGRRFFAAFQRAYGARRPDPHAVYGYEAMSLVLDALGRTGDGDDDREGLIAALFETRRRQSALGTYDVRATGDTTVTSYGIWRARSGRAVFERVARIR
jgi:branched-chain amino acid transport system substrate-binding protein